MSATSSQPANALSQAAGNHWTFVLLAVLILAWALTGPVFGFSDTWQLIANTGTTIITFLMVFIIQNTQNRDSPRSAGPQTQERGADREDGMR